MSALDSFPRHNWSPKAKYGPNGPIWGWSGAKMKGLGGDMSREIGIGVDPYITKASPKIKSCSAPFYGCSFNLFPKTVDDFTSKIGPKLELWAAEQYWGT